MNDYAKDTIRERIENHDTRRIRGIAAQTLLIAFQLAHANHRKLTAWADAITLNGDRRRHRHTCRRKTKPLATGPPRATTPGPRSPSPMSETAHTSVTH